MGTHAKRSGAHPFDAGHWYMDYKKNYAGMNIDAILAHELSQVGPDEQDAERHRFRAWLAELLLTQASGESDQ